MSQKVQMKELEDHIYMQILQLSKAADLLTEKEEYNSALQKYWSAYDLIPEPKTKWETSTWLLASIGDINFINKDFEAGVKNLSSAMQCPDAIGNPFIHLRLGQCQLEIGNKHRAECELNRAYTIKGKPLFMQEDKKYFDFLDARVDLSTKKKKWWKLMK
ncbi:hypothetical protein IZU89_11730 [Cellulophaga lytica]|uniref:hypothetical protein n=2 Tax=Cellulophaga lytica TaxID=979 RepID=UPI0032E3FC95